MLLPPELELIARLPNNRLKVEALKRLTVSKSPLSFVEFVSLVNPKYQWYPHVKQLAAILQRVADDELFRLMVFMPPRHGKSELVSRLFSAYYLYRHPERWVGINSYAAELAYTFSRNARDNYMRRGGKVKDDAAAVKHWETGEGGGLWAAGVGGPITGKGFHLGIIDDPIKNSEEAQSEIIRRKHKDWYDSTFSTREEPGAAIIIIQTRWHEDDLSGYVLSKEHEEPENWHIVHFEAIKEKSEPTYPPTCTVEPDPRKTGQPLAPLRYPLEKLRKIEKRILAYFFGALYQQRPRPREGGMFKFVNFKIVDAAPLSASRVRYWDKAGTEAGGKYSCGVLMARSDNGTFYVEDVVRGQWSALQRENAIKTTAELDRQRYGLVPNWTEQEPGSGGKESAESTVRNLAGFVVYSERVTGDKESRARPLSSQHEAGNVHLVKANWNAAYIEELTAFPNGVYSDQADGSSGAFNKLATSGPIEWDDVADLGTLANFESKWR